MTSKEQVNIFFGCVAALIFIVILAFWNYKINENNLMSKNIQDAMSKGIDPLSVRCTYAADTDNICLAYALRSREHNTEIPVPIRK
jgi:hypothetical protein